MILHSAPGLDPILWREVRGLDDSARNEGSRLAGGRNSLLLVESEDPEELLRSRIAEDLYATVLHTTELMLGRRGLTQLSSLIRETPEWDDALKLHAILTGGRGKRRISTYRVIARAQGERGYTRTEAARALATGLQSRLGKHWKLVPDNAQVEVWLTLIDSEALAGIRLTNRERRHRGKDANIPASLRPSIAAAMVYLSDSRENDVFLDPFCGAGTILLERGTAGRHERLIGSDISRHALEAAEVNIGGRHQPLDLHRWDATQMLLEDGSVSAIVSNLPFGEQLGSHAENEKLYPRVLAEAHRLLPPGGRLVLLTSERELMTRHLSPERWTLHGRFNLRVLGRYATIYSARRN